MHRSNMNSDSKDPWQPRRRRWILRVFGRASLIRKQCLFAPGTASD
jgi:hypothetical protein